MKVTLFLSGISTGSIVPDEDIPNLKMDCLLTFYQIRYGDNRDKKRSRKILKVVRDIKRRAKRGQSK